MVTIDQVLAWEPCYSAARIEKLFAGRPALSAGDIVALKISTEDKIWALLHNEFLADRQMHALACDFAERVAHLSDDPRVSAAIAAKRAWLRGEITDEELTAARDAAGNAALGAAYTAQGAAGAAQATVRIAAWAAARDAAWAAACASQTAGRIATWAATRDAARDITRDACPIAWAAARDAAWAIRNAARAAGRDVDVAVEAARKWQLDRIVSYLRIA